MKHILFFLLLIPAAGLWANYPEDVYFFELNPAVWEYFASPRGDKVSVYRTLSIENEVFSLHMKIDAFVGGENFRYTLVFLLNDQGDASLQSFSDGRSTAVFPRPLLFFPSGRDVHKAVRLLLATDIAWETSAVPPESYRSPDEEILCRLWVGRSSIEFLLRYQKGLSGLVIGGQRYSPVTRRVFNSI